MSGVYASTNGTLNICRRGTNKANSILLVALNRPRVKNAFNDAVYEDLVEILTTSAKDDTVAGIVLTGTGPSFSSGADLRGESMESSEEGRQSLHRPVGRYMMAVLAYPKIFGAAVNGPVVGIGTTTLLHCDLVFCTRTATFWAPFTRLAVIPELCSSVTLMNVMGLAKANEFLLLGEKADATKAVEWNICSRIVDNVDQSGDPFHPNSLASFMCQEIDKKLLSLPMGKESVHYFVSLVKGSRRKYLQSVCLDELVKLDERFDSGQVATALQSIVFGSKAKTKNKNNTTPTATTSFRSKL